MSALTSPPLARQSPNFPASFNAVSDTNSSLESHNPSTDGTSVQGSEEESSWTAGNSAIIGMACRVPGARNPQQLWKNIIEQKDVQRKIPKERFNVDAFFHPDGTNKGTVRFILETCTSILTRYRPMPNMDIFSMMTSASSIRSSSRSLAKKQNLSTPNSAFSSRSFMRR